MKQPTTINSLVHQAFAQRCAELNLSVWLCDSTGTSISGPDGAPAEQIRSLASHSALPDKPFALPDGRHLMLFEERQGSRRNCISAVVLPASESLQQLATMLAWSHSDLQRSLRDRTTVSQFSEQLAQAYEHNTLLHDLSSALNCDQHPDELLHMICKRLLEILPFGWIGIRFHQTNEEIKHLAGKFVLAGDAPCALDVFNRESLALLQSTDRESCIEVQTPGMSNLAMLVNSEVIAEPILHDDRVIAILLAGNKHGDDPAVSSFETQLLQSAAGFLGIFHENIARFVEQESQFYGTLRALTASIDAKDRYTHGHSERVSHLAAIMAQAMKLSPNVIEDYRVAGLVHDVGKIGVPEAILCKPGRPTDEEFARIRKHPQIGYDILQGIPKLSRALPAVLHHHERWDGRGYPHGIAGEAIPLTARVMALADAFDAMSSTRSYRPAISRDKCLTEILHCAGGQFDPDLVPTFVRLDFSGFDALVARHCAAERFAA